MTAMSGATGYSRGQGNKNKKEGAAGSIKTGPLSKHMEPIDFENMVIKQRNTSAHFKPKFKLKTDTLKKVLFRLKREKEELDQNLE